MQNEDTTMKITDKIISIPPYISTTWDRITALRMKNQELVITLRDNSDVTIPHLPSEIIDQLFNTHAAFLESKSTTQPQKTAPDSTGLEQAISGPMKIIFGTLDSLGQVLQHNPAHKDLAPFPPELLERVKALTQAIPPEDIDAMPEPEEGCNCMHCQIMRVLKNSSKKPIETTVSTEEEVRDEELRFEEWEVSPIGDKLYLVTNKLDHTEHYNVFLGEPIGCTCGKPHCEHIIAVLRH